MVGTMDKYYMIGTFALLATAVIALPTIFTESSSSEPTVAYNSSIASSLNSTEHSTTSVEPLPSVHPEHGIKVKRNIIEKFFFGSQVTDSPLSSSEPTTTGGVPAVFNFNLTEESTSQAAASSSSHHSLFRRDVTLIPAVSETPSAPANVSEFVFDLSTSTLSTPYAQNDELSTMSTPAVPSSSVSDVNASSTQLPIFSKYPIFIQNDESASSSSVAPALNETEVNATSSTITPIFTFPFFNKQNDELPSESPVSGSTESSLPTEGSSSSSSTASGSSTLYPAPIKFGFQNDEVASSSASSVSPSNVTVSAPASSSSLMPEPGAKIIS